MVAKRGIRCLPVAAPRETLRIILPVWAIGSHVILVVIHVSNGIILVGFALKAFHLPAQIPGV